jgi:hypothetical protein
MISLNPHFQMFLSVDVPDIEHLQQMSHCFVFTQPHKSLHCLLSSGATVNTMKISVAFKAKFDADMLLFHFCHLLKRQNHEWNKTVFYLTRHYLTTTHSTNLFQASNDSSDCCVYT